MKSVIQRDVVDDWGRIPETIRQAITDLDKKALDVRGGRAGMSAREIVHHLAEANIVVASIMIAAIGTNGATYDWSWLYPDTAWCERMGYPAAPIEPALDVIDALCRQISNLVAANPEILSREVRLFDTPGGETYTKTVADIMQQEIDHAAEHLSDIDRAG